ncbi:MAG: signal peptide peptidase SppA [Bacteroidales bacterium]|nr:signal peptide peptidase SppA [Bacteroidales bacterium]
MKKFFRTFFAVFLSSILCLFLCFFIVMGLIGSLSSPSEPTMPEKAVLHINMQDIVLAEQSMEDPFALLQGKEDAAKLGVWDAVQAINAAATDPQVSFIYLKPDFTAAGAAHVEELRAALEHFKKSCDKPIIAWMETPGNAGYYLGSVADEIYMTSAKGAGCQITGLATQLLFFKDLLDKLGINVQLIRHGKYKSAGEPFIRNDISPANRQQLEAALGSIWKAWCKQICASRSISVDKFNSLIDNLSLNFAEDMLREGLVDSLLSKEEMDAKLCALYGCECREDIEAISLAGYVKLKVKPNYKAKEKIAVIYADGDIVETASRRSTDPEIVGTDFAKLVSAVRKDKDVKAVVLRVNSPGGAVLAADKVRAEVELLCQEKPVVASFGNYAASGGYWISAGCKKIYTNNSTLTGSIGVFSMIPDLSKTTKNLAHLGVATICTNKHGDMYSMMRPLDSSELAYMQASVEDIYEGFTGLVAKGRGLEQKYVDSIAQGRVWSGAESMGIRLTDENGTLEDALQYAASIAEGDNGSDLSLWQVVSYPEPVDVLTMLATTLQSVPAEEEILSGTPFQGAFRQLRSLKASDYGKAYARLPFEIVIR